MWALYSFVTLGSEEESYKLKIGAYDPKSTKGDDWKVFQDREFYSYDHITPTNPHSFYTYPTRYYRSAGWCSDEKTIGLTY